MLKKEEFDALENKVKTEKENENFIRILSTYLNNFPDIITAQTMEEICKNGKSKSLCESAFSSFLSTLFIDNEELSRYYEKEYFRPSIKMLDAEEYRKNPYYERVKPKPEKIGKWSIDYQTYKAYEGFACDEEVSDSSEKELPHISFFNEEFSYLTVYENGIEWMAIKPNEIETMKEPIEKAHGKVVAFGLGLGYFAYMTARKEDVTSVTVVERDENVIKLFRENILPYFDVCEKIRIVKCDAFDYVEKEMKKENFGYAFVDLWHDVSDGTDLYIKMRKAEVAFPKTEFSYWIENMILASVRRKVLYGIYESEKKNTNSLSLEEIEKRLKFSYLREFVRYV